MDKVAGRADGTLVDDVATGFTTAGRDTLALAGGTARPSEDKGRYPTVIGESDWDFGTMTLPTLSFLIERSFSVTLLAF
jgi:hypothetical protein